MTTSRKVKSEKCVGRGAKKGGTRPLPPPTHAHARAQAHTYTHEVTKWAEQLHLLPTRKKPTAKKRVKLQSHSKVWRRC